MKLDGLDLFLKHLEALQHQSSATISREMALASATVCMFFRMPIFKLLLWSGASSFLSWKNLNKTRFSWIGSITQDLSIQWKTKSWRLSWFHIMLPRWTMKPFSHFRRLSALPQSWQSVELEMRHGHQSLTRQQILQLPSNMAVRVIRNLTEHFKKVKNMAEVTATRVVREMSGEVTLRDLSDTKKCLPPWLIMHDSYREYALKCGYEVTFNNRSHASSKWVGKGPEPKRGINWSHMGSTHTRLSDSIKITGSMSIQNGKMQLVQNLQKSNGKHINLTQ